MNNKMDGIRILAMIGFSLLVINAIDYVIGQIARFNIFKNFLHW